MIDAKLTRSLSSYHSLQILNVKRAYGMSTQDFYFLMQRAAEEANLMTLDEHFDNWIPTVPPRFVGEKEAMQ
jgi:hypothetical protein